MFDQFSGADCTTYCLENTLYCEKSYDGNFQFMCSGEYREFITPCDFKRSANFKYVYDLVKS